MSNLMRVAPKTLPRVSMARIPIVAFANTSHPSAYSSSSWAESAKNAADNLEKSAKSMAKDVRNFSISLLLYPFDILGHTCERCEDCQQMFVVSILLCLSKKEKKKRPWRLVFSFSPYILFFFFFAFAYRICACNVSLTRTDTLFFSSFPHKKKEVWVLFLTTCIALHPASNLQDKKEKAKGKGVKSERERVNAGLWKKYWSINAPVVNIYTLTHFANCLSVLFVSLQSNTG